MPSVNKHLVMQLIRCEYADRRENVIAIGNNGTGKTHVALGLVHRWPRTAARRRWDRRTWGGGPGAGGAGPVVGGGGPKVDDPLLSSY